MMSELTELQEILKRFVTEIFCCDKRGTMSDIDSAIERMRGKLRVMSEKEESNSEKKIDFSGFSDYVIKQGLLVEVRSDGEPWKSFYHGVSSVGYSTYCDGLHPSKAHERSATHWEGIRLLDNNPMPWFGGECPIPDGVRFSVWYRSGVIVKSVKYIDVGKLSWGRHGEAGSDIIAFQILESEWQS
jgi:hypothetical protein